jgi:hypothetical protein
MTPLRTISVMTGSGRRVFLAGARFSFAALLATPFADLATALSAVVPAKAGTHNH